MRRRDDPRSPTWLAIACAALSAGGCGSPTSPGDRARLILDAALVPPSDSAAARVGVSSGAAAVRLTLRHTGGRAVALTGCPAPPAVRFERSEAGAWRDAGSSGILCLAIYSPSTVSLAAGGRLSAVLAVPAGRYRFTVPVGPDAATPDADVRSVAVEVP